MQCGHRRNLIVVNVICLIYSVVSAVYFSFPSLKFFSETVCVQSHSAGMMRHDAEGAIRACGDTCRTSVVLQDITSICLFFLIQRKIDIVLQH